MQGITGSWRAALVALMLVAPAAAAENSFWGNDLEAARKTAAQTNRLLLVHFSASWCQPCQQLEREVLNRPDFGQQLQNDFVGVKLDYDLFPATRRKYGVQSIPTDVILTPQGQLIERVQSPRTAQDYVGTMTRIAAAVRSGAATQTAAVPTATPLVAAAGMPPQVPPAANPAQPTGAAATPAAPPADDRYADYYNRRRSGAPEAAALGAVSGAAAAAAAMPSSSMPSANAPSAALPATTMPATTEMVGPSLTPPANPAAPPAAAPMAPAVAMTAQPFAAVPPSAAAGMAPPAAATAAAPYGAQPVAGAPVAPLEDIAPPGLDGFCPVTMCEKKVWTPGDKRYGMQHRGRTYLFAGPEEMRRFSENPDRYSPVMSGVDPVLAIDHGLSMPGQRMYGLTCGGRIYLFSSEETLQQFTQNLNHYVPAALEARRP